MIDPFVLFLVCIEITTEQAFQDDMRCLYDDVRVTKGLGDE
jgi:hypothetical protein